MYSAAWVWGLFSRGRPPGPPCSSRTSTAAPSPDRPRRTRLRAPSGSGKGGRPPRRFRDRQVKASSRRFGLGSGGAFEGGACVPTPGAACRPGMRSPPWRRSESFRNGAGGTGQPISESRADSRWQLPERVTRVRRTHAHCNSAALRYRMIPLLGVAEGDLRRPALRNRLDDLGRRHREVGREEAVVAPPARGVADRHDPEQLRPGGVACWGADAVPERVHALEPYPRRLAVDVDARLRPADLPRPRELRRVRKALALLPGPTQPTRRRRGRLRVERGVHRHPPDEVPGRGEMSAHGLPAA